MRFKERLGLPFHLLSDPDKRIMRLYGVTRRLAFLPNKRVTYVVDKEGKIAGVFHHELAFDRHVQRVVETLRATNDAMRER